MKIQLVSYVSSTIYMNERDFNEGSDAAFVALDLQS